eukprot:6833642-Prymnesium_polylepis.2
MCCVVPRAPPDAAERGDAVILAALWEGDIWCPDNDSSRCRGNRRPDGDDEGSAALTSVTSTPGALGACRLPGA